MKRKVIETMRDLLVILMNHFALIGLGIAVMGLFGQRYIWLWGILLIVPLVLYLVRVKIKNYFLFFPLHLFLPVIALMAPVWIVPKITMVIIVLIYTVWSVFIRLQSKTMGEELIKPVLVIGLLGVLAVVDNLFNKMGVEWIYIAMALAYIAGYFIYSFVNEYLSFLTVNESSVPSIPEQEIFSSGMKLTFLFMSVSLVVLLLTGNVGWLAYIMSWLGKGVLAAVRFLISLLAGEKEEELLEDVEALEDILANLEREKYEGDSLVDDGYGNEQGELWLTAFLDKNILTIVGGSLAVLLVIVMVIGYLYIRKNYHARSEEEVEKLQTIADIRETCTIEKNKKETSDLFAFLKPAERVRKIYRKQILKHKKEIIGENSPEELEYMTAEECCDKISSDDMASIKDLKFVYEKARYSAEEISADDVKRIKLSI